ncbi:MAG: dephospho-CoA kinase [Woeseiaceae bacterium]|nr:dephospho-CoA kinase [Woeseiaceae bacterium]
MPPCGASCSRTTTSDARWNGYCIPGYGKRHDAGRRRRTVPGHRRAAALAESPMRHQMDRILVVDVPEDVQLERLLERDAEDAAQARRMMDAQASRPERLAIADDVLTN